MYFYNCSSKWTQEQSIPKDGSNPIISSIQRELVVERNLLNPTLPKNYNDFNSTTQGLLGPPNRECPPNHTLNSVRNNAIFGKVDPPVLEVAQLAQNVETNVQQIDQNSNSVPSTNLGVLSSYDKVSAGKINLIFI